MLNIFIHFRRILAAALLLCFSCDLPAQVHKEVDAVTRTSDPIEWIGQIPSPEKHKKQGLLNRLGNFILGPDPQLIIKPVGMVAGDNESYWILSQGNGLIVRILEGKQELPAVIRKRDLYFPSLAGICRKGTSGYLFTDSEMELIWEISADGSNLSVIGNELDLNRPTGIAYNEASDCIWVINTGTHNIYVLSGEGKLLRTVGTRGTGDGEFNYPTHIWIDLSGNVYIVDSMNFRVQIFNQDGDFISSFGRIGDSTGFFARPKGIATDSRGNIYIADALFHAVQVFDTNGNLLHYFGSQGHDRGQFWMPAGLFIDDDDNIYVTDSYNTRIQIFRLSKPDH